MKHYDVQFATEDVTVYLAGAGAGKTHAMMGAYSEVLKTYRPEEIGMFTFTRKGVQNFIERVLKENKNLVQEDLYYVQTLHAMTFREAGLKHKNIIELRDIKKFNEMTGFNLNLAHTFDNQSDDDKLMQRYDAERSGAEEGVFMKAQIDEERYTRLINAYEVFKSENDLVDFFDCLVRFKANNRALPIKVFMVDEAQDLTHLHWQIIEIASRNAEKIVVAGDDFQCQPAGEPVLTMDGYVPIEEAHKHKAIVWDKDAGQYYGHGGRHANGRSFNIKRSVHEFSGKLVCVTHSGGVSRFTPNHKMIIKWNNKGPTLFVVYLMRRGNNFRIGMTRAFGSQGETRLFFRFNQECADAMWVVFSSENKREVEIQEQVLSAKYGLPQNCFEWGQDIADAVFGVVDTAPRARKLLRDKGLLEANPLITREMIGKKRFGSFISEIAAVNLIPAVMMVPRMLDKRHTAWEKFTVERVPYKGKVYGLDVEKYHNYVTRGIVTHNSLFTYSGASPETLVHLANKYKLVKLETSYRLPRAVYRFARGITNMISMKVDKDYVPAHDKEGFVEEISDRDILARKIRIDLEQNGPVKSRWYLLFRANHFIAGMADKLEFYATPYHTSRGFCIPERELSRIVRYYNYRKEGYGTAEAKARFMKDFGITEFSKPFIESDLIPSERKYVYYDYCERWGAEELLRMSKAEPTVLLATTYKVKGGECDYCAVFLDNTKLVDQNTVLDLDSELRVLYVACTRPREGLYLVSSEGYYGHDMLVRAIRDLEVE
jgi:hypothetical protein